MSVGSGVMDIRMTRRPLVLIVDDDHAYRDAVAEILNFEGYDTRKASSVPAALAILRSMTPDLIISDTLTSKPDGVSMLQAVRSHAAWEVIPLITASANAMLSDKVAAFAAGASGFLPKPFSTVDLLAEVGQQLTRTGVLVEVD
jgi:DNA-binding response OmpR family regulator